MTEHNETDGQSLDSALSAARTSLLVSIQILENELEEMRDGDNSIAKKYVDAAKAVNHSLRLFLIERERLEDLTGKFASRGMAGELDLTSAWDEINGRMARLRPEGDAESVLE